MASSKYDIELDLAKSPDTSHAYMVELVGSNKRVLDVGCATGYLAKTLTAFGNVVSGVEYDAAAAEQARSYLDRLVVGDLEQLDLVAELGEGSYDVVVFGDVLEHLRDPLPVLRQARPLLKVGGSVVVSVPNIAHGDVRLALLKGRFNYTKVGLLDDTHVRFFTRESLDTFLRDAGFLAVDVRRTTADLFTTEIGLRREDYDAQTIEELRADPEALTYQFVVRAVRDDAAHVEAEVLARIEQQRVRVHELERTLSERLEHVGQLENALADQRRLAEHYRDELQALSRTKLVRAARLPRAVWSVLKGRSPAG